MLVKVRHDLPEVGFVKIPRYDKGSVRMFVNPKKMSQTTMLKVKIKYVFTVFTGQLKQHSKTRNPRLLKAQSLLVPYH